MNKFVIGDRVMVKFDDKLVGLQIKREEAQLKAIMLQLNSGDVGTVMDVTTNLIKVKFDKGPELYVNKKIIVTI